MSLFLVSVLVLTFLFVAVTVTITPIQAIGSNEIELTPGDYSLVTKTTVTNVSVYLVSDLYNTTTSNATSGAASASTTTTSSPPEPPPSPVLRFDSLSVIGGTSENAIKYAMLQLVTDPNTPLFRTDADQHTPVLFPFTQQGYQKYFSRAQLFYPSSPATAADSDFHLTSNAALQALVRVATTNWTDQDAIKQGEELKVEESFAPADLLYSAEERTYANLTDPTDVTFEGEIDPELELAAQDLGFYDPDTGLPPQDVIRTENLNNEVNKEKTHAVLLAGFDDFQDKAVDQPILEYALSLLNQNASLLSLKGLSQPVLTTDDLLVVYDGLSELVTDVQYTRNFRDFVLQPVRKSLEDQNNNNKLDLNPFDALHHHLHSFWGTTHGQAKVTVKFFGFPLLWIRTTAAFRFKMPNIRVSGIVHGATKTFNKYVSKPVSTLAKGSTKWLHDTAGAVGRAVLNAPKKLSKTVKNLGDKVGHFTENVKKALPKPPKISIKTPKLTLPKVKLPNVFGSIYGGALKGILSTLSPFIMPFLAIGAIIIAGYLFIQFVLPRILMKKMVKG